jgi:mRNA interferase MazF
VPRRGDVYDFNPDPVVGRELGKKIRPCIVVSDDNFNLGASRMIVVIPTTSTIPTNNPLRYTVQPPEGGFDRASSICCDHVRSVSIDRLIAYRGRITGQTMSALEMRLRRLLSV